MKPHKWVKEIKAWADGETIQYQYGKCEWRDAKYSLDWDDANYTYRIKPQPQYLYVYWNEKDTYSAYAIDQDTFIFQDKTKWKCVGKVKLEDVENE